MVVVFPFRTRHLTGKGLRSIHGVPTRGWDAELAATVYLKSSWKDNGKLLPCFCNQIKAGRKWLQNSFLGRSLVVRKIDPP